MVFFPSCRLVSVTRLCKASSIIVQLTVKTGLRGSSLLHFQEQPSALYPFAFIVLLSIGLVHLLLLMINICCNSRFKCSYSSGKRNNQINAFPISFFFLDFKTFILGATERTVVHTQLQLHVYLGGSRRIRACG